MKRTFVSLVLIYAILLVSVVSPVAAQFGDRSTEPYCGGGYRTDSFYLDSRGLHGAQYVYSTDDQHAGGRLFEQFVTLQDEGWVEGVGYIPTYFVTGGYYQYYDNSPLRYVSWRLGTSYIYYSTHANPTQDDYQVYNILLINDAWWVWCGQWLLRTVDNGYEECNVSCEVSKQASDGDCYGSFKDLDYWPLDDSWEDWDQLNLWCTNHVGTYEVSVDWFLTWGY